MAPTPPPSSRWRVVGGVGRRSRTARHPDADRRAGRSGPSSWARAPIARARSTRTRPPWGRRARTYLERANGTQPGDPRKAANAILAALDAVDAPLRLALGADAVDALRAKHERLRADLDEWESVSRDTAFD